MTKSAYSKFLTNLYFADLPSDYIKQIPENNLYELFQELAILKSTPQEPEWHPEGNVFEHTMMVIDEAANLKMQIQNQDDRNIIMLASLCHDFGKAVTTFQKNGRIVSPMHEQKGMPISMAFMEKLEVNSKYISPVLDLVREHLRPTQLFIAKNNVSNNAIIRLTTRVNIDLLLLVAEADHFGRLTNDAIDRDFPAKEWLIARYKAVL